MARRRLSGLSGKQIVRALERDGFEVVRVSGSHHILRKPGFPNTKVIVPVHGARDTPPGTVRTIIRQAGLSIERFIALL
ncbi:MAG: addiction module toxin, HicA family protein [Alphaproteobacteria bacterium]|nr:MAG: addiction module toxin, HicA family protein [Alphaproteobacteria bacterium]